MKPFLTLLMLFASASTCSSQTVEEGLIGTWALTKDTIDIIQFESGNQALYQFQGRILKVPYYVQDSLLQLGTSIFKVSHLDDVKLVLSPNRLSLSGDRVYRKSSVTLELEEPVRIYTDSFSNGQVKVYGKIINGFHHGEWKEWYKNGQLKSLSHFNMDEPVGEWKEWYDNGQIKYSRTIVNGLPVGELKRWYRNGQLQELAVYDYSGKIVKSQRWKEDGTLEE